MEYLAKNKIMAEFMGLEEIYTPMENIYEISATETVLESDLPYHDDFNSLMPVLHKCIKICHEKMLEEWENSFADKFLACDFDTLYYEAFEFIVWYNKNFK